MNEIYIDGSIGEGGGQVFRTSLTCSLLTGQTLHINKIRANRSSPGLKHQHLTALLAACEISNAEVGGNYLGSEEVSFIPGKTKSGTYRFNIPTAGSTGLVLQTVYLPLSMLDKPSRIVIRGGTHVPWSPTFHYLDWHWLSWMKKIGYPGSFDLIACGYFPVGGGEISCRINPAKKGKMIDLADRGKLLQIRGVSAVTNLPLEIAKRQRQRLVSRLGSIYPLHDIKVQSLPGKGKGTFLVVLLEFEHSTACLSALGRKGKRAETVADELVDQVNQMIASDGCVDRFLLDQLLLPLAFSKLHATIRTSQITNHLLTNIRVIRKFNPANIKISGKLNRPGFLRVNY